MGLAVAANLWVNYIEYVIHASRMTLSHFPMGTLMVYLALALVLNPICRLLVRRYALSSTELLVGLGGGLVGGAIPSVGLTGYFLGAVAAPFYFATPENRWGEFFHPYILEWLAPRNVNGALDYLFEGLPPGEPIPWAVWYVPVACWMALVTALFAASVCIAVILRKQWVENERLTYPVLQPALELTARSETGDFPRLFWIGFSVAFGIIAWNMIHYFVPGFPEIPNIRWGPWVRFERYFPGVWTRVNMFTISFCYFANIDVLFSMWFFDLLFVIRSGILNQLGYNASSWSHASADFQYIPLGALFALVAWGVWSARGHLKMVVKKALGREAPLDESEEMMNYRTAVLGLVVSVLFGVLWFWQAGMGFGVACLFVFAALVLYIGGGANRVRHGAGICEHASGAPGVCVLPVRVSEPERVQPDDAGVYQCDRLIRKGVVYAGSHARGEACGCVSASGAGGALAALFLAFGAGCAVSILFTLYLGYTYGAYNFNDYPFTRYSKSGFSGVVAQMNNPEPPNRLRLSLFGIGVVAMSLLTFLKYRFPWWPFHPVGFALAGTGTSVRYTVFSVFLAWAIKFVLLRIGGVALYRRCRPFFLGVLVGYTAGVGGSLLVDIVWFPRSGHSIHGY